MAKQKSGILLCWDWSAFSIGCMYVPCLQIENQFNFFPLSSVLRINPSKQPIKTHVTRKHREIAEVNQLMRHSQYTEP